MAPGWDVSRDWLPDHRQHLATYGLGSPYPEDTKLCAALSSFWPAVSPDATREFSWPDTQGARVLERDAEPRDRPGDPCSMRVSGRAPSRQVRSFGRPSPFPG